VELNEYQKTARATASYPGLYRGDLTYPTLGLAGESGEFADKVKKLMRNKDVSCASQLDLEDTRALVKELGDVLWYVSDLATSLGVTLENVAHVNIQKLQDRAKRGVIKSEGDNR
jgi:NTP pyrophosphatase (non-canonical NTP hydrolase)